jgi:hypothetical protein
MPLDLPKPPETRPPFDTVEEAWLLYAREIPRDAHPARVMEARRSFFLGAIAAFDLAMRLGPPPAQGMDPEPTPQDLERLKRLHEELSRASQRWPTP